MNRFIIRAALVSVLALPLGGCDVQTASAFIQNVIADIVRLARQVKPALEETSEAIRVGCNAIGLAEQEAYMRSQACGQKVSRLKAGITAICVNRALLTDTVAGNYLRAVADAVKNAKC